MKTANETRRVGEYDLPYILSSINMYPDFIALYGEFSKYKLTYRTCVAFYEYDQVFDGIKGIWNAIYHDIRKWQFYYLNRFAGVKYFIAPDCSLCGDVNKIENLHRALSSSNRFNLADYEFKSSSHSKYHVLKSRNFSEHARWNGRL